jgi:hypothetical protein
LGGVAIFNLAFAVTREERDLFYWVQGNGSGWVREQGAVNHIFNKMYVLARERTVCLHQAARV